MAHDTKQHLLERGMAMLLRQGYHDLEIALDDQTQKDVLSIAFSLKGEILHQ